MLKKRIAKIIYSVNINQYNKYLKYKAYHIERDVYNIISIVFNIETALRMGESIEDCLEIPVSLESFYGWDINAIETALTLLIKEVTYKNIRIGLVAKDLSKGRINKKISFKPSKNICLFSGGIDSTTGLVLSLNKLKDVSSLFVCHTDQGKINIIVNNIKKIVNSKYTCEHEKIYVPKMYSLGYSQLRGFLYILCGAIFANLKGARSIIVAECGPTMYQVKFSPFDSVTMTTHPTVLKYSKQLIKLFFKKDIKLILPFENLTKAEVAILNPFPEIFPSSHSCISSRWIGSGVNGQEANDGVCYGCIVRRLGLVVAGVADAHYEYDPLNSEAVYGDNLYHLLAYCVEVMIDFDGIDDYSKEIINEYGKKDLYKRFALDNLAALHILYKNNNLNNRYLLQHYIDFAEKYDTNILEKRIIDVRSKNRQANFNKYI